MIKDINKDNLKEALDLVNKVFEEYVAPEFSKKGLDTFHDYLGHKYDEVSADLLSGHKKMWGYYIDDKIIGVIAIRDISHISLFFVDSDYHKKGIAKNMFNMLLNYLAKEHSDVKKITVNSSLYAVNIYKKLGFTQLSERQENDGIIYVPMEYII